MTTSLTWEPEEQTRPTLSDEMKYICRVLFGTNAVGLVDCILDAADIERLRGVRAGTTRPETKRDVDALISAITVHGRIYLKERE